VGRDKTHKINKQLKDSNEKENRRQKTKRKQTITGGGTTNILKRSF